MSASDSELLEQYAPVLRFSQGERFFPMKIEDYLSQCEAYRNVQFGIVHLVISLILLTIAAWAARYYLGVSPWWTVGLGLFFLASPFGFRIKNWDKQEDKAAALGSRQDSNYYLRYARSTDVVTGCFFIILVLVVVLFAFLQGPGQAVRVAITGLLIYSAFSLLFKSDLLMFISISIGMGVGVYYLLAYLYSLIGLWISCGILIIGIAFVLFFMQELLPRVGGFVALFSRATDAAAESAYDPHYKKILEQYQKTGENPYCYYGRVVADHDQDGNWTILQYNYFYAFNDWRVAAIGFNNHEGDWEAVSVFLKDGNPQPVGVAFSQHHEGVYRTWEQVSKVANPQEPYHPLVYVALGSHANYDKYNVSPLPDMWQPNPVQKFVSRIDAFLRRQSREQKKPARGLVVKMGSKGSSPRFLKNMLEKIEKDEEVLQGKLDAVKAGLSQWGKLRPLDDTWEAGTTLPCEFHAGDGHRIGAPGDLMQEDIAFSGKMLPSGRKNEVSQPQSYAWQLQLIPRNSAPAWVEYQGLWGIKSLLPDESGPPGPKWDRVNLKEAFLKYARKPRQRLRWENPLEWRNRLLKAMQSPKM